MKRKRLATLLLPFLSILICLAGFSFPVGAQDLSEPDLLVLAEKVSPSELRAGEKLVIVCQSNDMGLSTQAQSSSRLSGGKVTIGHMAGREVLTAMPQSTAVYELIEAEDGWYLHCDAGYLTSSDNGNALFYDEEVKAGSRW